MKIFRLVVPVLAGLVLAGGTLVAFARGQAAPALPPATPPHASETQLLPSGFAEAVHTDAAGHVWVTEVSSNSVRELNPGTRAYTLYTGLAGPHDAQIGPDGQLWWLQSAPQAVARMDLGTRLVTTWPVTTNFAVALAFDPSGRPWFVDGILSGVYRLDPNTNTYCDFTLPGGGGGPFIVAHDGALWLSDIVSSTLGRITPTTNAYTYWPLNFGGGFPEPFGATFAPNGDVWWADRGLGKLGRLEPGTGHLHLYGPDGLVTPQQVAYEGGKVWFTDPVTGVLGYVDPALAVGLGPYVVTPTTTILTSDCGSVTPGAFTAGIQTGVASFSPLVFTGTADAEGTLFYAPASGEPYALATLAGDLWVTDVGRDTLMHLETALHLYLPLVKR